MLPEENQNIAPDENKMGLNDIKKIIFQKVRLLTDAECYELLEYFKQNQCSL